MRNDHKYNSLLFLSLVFIAFVLSPTSAQDTEQSMKLDAARPSVYLAFMGFEPRSPLREGESGTGVRLKLSNNIRYPIRFCTFYSKDGVLLAFKSHGAEMGINYSIERLPNRLGRAGSKEGITPPQEIPPGYPTGSMCLYGELNGGESVTFLVPVEHLAENLSIRIPFEYAWEKGEFAPIHFVTFDSSQIQRKD